VKTLDDYRLDAVIHLRLPSLDSYRLRVGVDQKHLVIFSEAQRTGAKYAVEVTTLERLSTGRETIATLAERVRLQVDGLHYAQRTMAPSDLARPDELVEFPIQVGDHPAVVV